MTTRQIKTVFILVLGLCVLAMVFSYTLFENLEVDVAVDWTMKYFALPILIVMIPICNFIYKRIILQHERKIYYNGIWAKLRSPFRIIILTSAMTGIFIGTTLSLILLTNAYFGERKTIKLHAKIVDYHTLTYKRLTRHYIKIQDQQLDRTIELKVQRPYKVGQTFNKTMLIGKWGLLYSEK